METRQERLAVNRQQKIQKHIGIYTQCMKDYLALNNPVLVRKSECLFPNLSEGEVFLPLHKGEEYLAFYTDFFDDVTKELDWGCDICSLIFKEI